MWDTVRNPEVGSLETLILLPEAADLLHRALMLSSATGSLLQSLPEPRFPGLFHGEIICPTNSPELSWGLGKSISPTDVQKVPIICKALQ